MKSIKNFKRYHPDSADKKALELSVGAIFLISEDGQDWYECQKSFQPDTMKVEYEADGVIRSMGYYISGFCPEGCSVAEVSEWPKESVPNRKWCFVDGEVVSRVYTADKLKEQATHKRDYLLEQAAKIIAPLQGASDLDIATEAEKAALLAWKKYRVLLNRADISKAPDIAWP
ncbi:tail fiber assembly protein [Candidatus Symbiopectobacterium endolongispinus]|uniref:tail fiber assembly protein n=1 Tax=Candidatus Symbiopectobacterium endolongispinus TaxID=2812664 RepID=UPI0020798207|nr:tail fiber assembly protein [Candidatus Symbiopectobacterium endolongispinus]MBT9429956.1 tail fiber assembly protein [Candidatus Symbiopectobacterium endolongispinus]